MSVRGLLHLVVVYIVWGSTYLAIRVAVREGGGFPPFIMAAMRVLLACVVLFAWARIARSNIRITRREAGILFVVATLLWVGGNGLVAFAEQRAESGYAALLVGALPIWVAIMEAIIDRKRPTLRFIGALMIGLSGVAVLNGPVLMKGNMADIIAMIALLAAPIFWGMGSILQRRRPAKVGPEANSAWQQLFGGISLLIVALLAGEPKPTPIPAAWVAWAYLVIFGSVFAFTSFIKALILLPTPVVMTYAYVNPVVAVFLGWLILREPFTIWTATGSVLVILGVAGVFHEKRRESRAGRKAGLGPPPPDPTPQKS